MTTRRQNEENNLACSTKILAGAYFALAQCLHLRGFNNMLLDFRSRDGGKMATLLWHEKTKKTSVKTASEWETLSQ